MPLIKCIALFQQSSNAARAATQTRIGGWSEGVYSLNESFESTRFNFQQLCQARAVLLPSSGSIIGQRYQLIDPTGRSSTASVSFPGSPISSDVPQMALTFTMAGVGVPNIRRVTLRGVPDSLVFQGEYSPTPEYTAALNAYVAWLPYFRFKAHDTAQPKINLLNIGADGVFTLAAPLTFARGDQFYIAGAKYPAKGQFFGYKRVIVATSTTVGQFANWTEGALTEGVVQKQQTIYPNMAAGTASVPSVVVRKVGRPFVAYRGRASRRA